MGNGHCPCTAAPSPPVYLKLGGSSPLPLKTDRPGPHWDPGCDDRPEWSSASSRSTPTAASGAPPVPCRDRHCEERPEWFSPRSGSAPAALAAGPTEDLVNSWDFNALELGQQHLVQVAHDLLRIGYLDCGGHDKDCLCKFLSRVKAEYLPNSFHGFHHAVDVLKMVLQLGSLMPWEVLCSPSRQFALLVAAASHDVGHPGFSNVFLVEACDELAFRYNDVSPLENMHCTKLFEILRMKDSNVFSHLPKREIQPLRKLMLDAILHTDAARHRKVAKALDAMRGHAEGTEFTEEQMAELNSDEQALLLRGLLIAADLSHAARPWEVSKAWAVRMQEEMFMQGDQERLLGIPVQPHNDRKLAVLPDVQLGFIHTVVMPVVSAEVRLFHEWRQLGQALVVNAKEWASLLAATGEERASHAPAEAEADLLIEKECSFPSARNQREEDQEPCSEPSVQNTLLATDSEVGTPVREPMVREVRRWREHLREGGLHREIALLYMVCEDAGGTGTHGQPILFRYSLQGEHHRAEPRCFPSEASSFTEPTPVLQSMDADGTALDTPGFEALLSRLLIDHERSEHSGQRNQTLEGHHAVRYSGGSDAFNVGYALKRRIANLASKTSRKTPPLPWSSSASSNAETRALRSSPTSSNQKWTIESSVS